MSALGFTLMGFVLGQLVVVLAMYIGELLHHDELS